MRRTFVVVFAVTAFAFIGSPVWADLVHDHVLDQYQLDQNVSYTVGTPSGLTIMAQTFTAGSDGILCHIQIGNESGVIYAPACPPIVQIRNTIENEYGLFQPGSTIYGSVPLEYPVPYFDKNTGKWIPPEIDEVGWTPLIDFSVPVSQGTMYSIVLSSSIASGTVSVGATAFSDPYESGALWATNDTGTWQLLSNRSGIPIFDMQFQTYVQVVPLPAGVWLGICAVSVAGLHLKRQSV